MTSETCRGSYPSPEVTPITRCDRSSFQDRRLVDGRSPLITRAFGRFVKRQAFDARPFPRVNGAAGKQESVITPRLNPSWQQVKATESDDIGDGNIRVRPSRNQ